jgi:hypothetical protein
MDESRHAVEPVTQLALFQLECRLLVEGSRKECWGFHRTAGDARLAGRRLNHPAARST